MRDIKKVYLIKKDVGGRATMGPTNPMIEGFLENVFTHIGESYRGGAIPTDVPVLKFGAKELTAHLLDRRVVTNRQLYSPLELVSRASSKRGLYNLMSGLYLPKTVFNRERAMALRFPVIVKPINGWAGRGAYAVGSPRDLPDDEMVFQEHVKIKHEYRYTMVKGKVIFVAERVPTNTKAKALQAGEPRPDLASTRNKFSWRPKILSKVISSRGWLGEILHIAQVVMHKTELGYAGIDLAVDTDNKSWLIEVNTSPGMTHNQSVLLYQNIFQDWYGRPVEPETQELLDAFGNILEDARKRFMRERYTREEE